LGLGAQGSRREAQTKPWGAFSFAFFSLGKQRKEGRVRCAQRFSNLGARRRADKKAGAFSFTLASRASCFDPGLNLYNRQFTKN